MATSVEECDPSVQQDLNEAQKQMGILMHVILSGKAMLTVAVDSSGRRHHVICMPASDQANAPAGHMDLIPIARFLTSKDAMELRPIDGITEHILKEMN